MKDKIIEKQDELLTLYESYIQKMNDASKLAKIHDNELAQEVWHEAIVMRASILHLNSRLADLKSQDKEVTDELQEFMNDVHNWADTTFGKERTALAPLYHLKKEVDEAIESMQTHNSWITIEELADCFILIINSSSKYGLTFDELFRAAKEKMIKNKSRKWGNPDKNGVVEHIRHNK